MSPRSFAVVTVIALLACAASDPRPSNAPDASDADGTVRSLAILPPITHGEAEGYETNLAHILLEQVKEQRPDVRVIPPAEVMESLRALDTSELSGTYDQGVQPPLRLQPSTVRTLGSRLGVDHLLTVRFGANEVVKEPGNPPQLQSRLVGLLWSVETGDVVDEQRLSGSGRSTEPPPIISSSEDLKEPVVNSMEFGGSRLVALLL